VDQRHQRRHRHRALEVERQEQRDQHEEHGERDERLLGDLAAPAPAHRADADHVRRGHPVRAAWAEGVEQRLLHGDRLGEGQRLRPDQHHRRRAGARRLHGCGLDVDGLLEDLLYRGHRGGGRGRVGRELDLRAAGEVDAEVEPAEHDRRHATSTSRPKPKYQVLRRPTMSNAPVPV
jgi:hypothetical protein